VLTQQSITINENLAKINEAIEYLTRQCRADETIIHRGDTSEEVSSQTSSVAATKWQKIKPSQPSEFNRNHAKGHAFINSCMLYITLCVKD
jgi:hypothetical protein